MTSTYRDLQPLSAEVIETQLEELLDPVLSIRRTAHKPAKALAKFTRRDQQFVLNWLRIITKTSKMEEMGERGGEGKGNSESGGKG